MVLFRAEGKVAALEDRCCHRHLPLSCGTVEGPAIRCGYHGLLFAPDGQCTRNSRPGAHPEDGLRPSLPAGGTQPDRLDLDGPHAGSQPTSAAPEHPWHDDPRYQFTGDVYHYKAPYQLIHDNLLDLSHLGYVHTRTIGGNAKIHVQAEMTVTNGPDWVRVVRHMRDSEPPPTYREAWPFEGRIDRWQDIEFRVSYFLIWTGGMDAGTGDLDDPARAGFHMRGFHGITPETESTSFYFWTISSNRNPATRIWPRRSTTRPPSPSTRTAP